MPARRPALSVRAKVLGGFLIVAAFTVLVVIVGAHPVGRRGQLLGTGGEALGGDVASAAEAVSSDAGTVSASTSQLVASIQEIAETTSRSADVANDAAQAERTTSEIVAGLASSSRAIDEVVGLIHSIAEQTNLLALNATNHQTARPDASTARDRVCARSAVWRPWVSVPAREGRRRRLGRA